MVKLQRGPGEAATMSRKGRPCARPGLLLFAGLLLATTASAVVTTNLTVNQNEGRGAVIVKTPSANPRGATWALPVVVLLHERCKDAATADSDPTFSFSPLVDKVRAPRTSIQHPWPRDSGFLRA